MTEKYENIVQKRNKRMSELRQQIKMNIGHKATLNLCLQKDNLQKEENCLKRTKNRKESTVIQTEQLFHSKYQTLNKLGQGTSGIVYLCRHIQSGQQYALKVMRFETEQITYFKDSFVFINQLEHASIIKYKALYISTHTNKVYLVMEKFSHPDLLGYELKNEIEARLIAEKLLSAIDYLHQNGICHRDIKPDNILYDPVGQEIKIIDFNISKRIKYRKRNIEMMTPTGTPQYRAPETFRGTVYTERVDQWSIGVTLYKLIAKKHPFQFESSIQRKKQFSKNYTELLFKEDIWDLYSDQCKDLISKLIAPDNVRIHARDALHHIWLTTRLDHRKISKQMKGRLSKKMTCNAEHSDLQLFGEQNDGISLSQWSPEQASNNLSWGKIVQKNDWITPMKKKLIKDCLIRQAADHTTFTSSQSIHYDSDEELQVLTTKKQPSICFKIHEIAVDKTKQDKDYQLHA